MALTPPLREGIKDVFYRTRISMGRGYSVRRFAKEVLNGTVQPITLNSIETGVRFPTEALVRRLAAVRKEEPQVLLAMLWRDRMLHGFGRELRRVLQAPPALGSIDDADLAVLVSHAIASLPPDDKWMSIAAWRKAVRSVPQGPGQTPNASRDLLGQVEEILRERKVIEIRGARVRSVRSHFIAEGDEERLSLALKYCGLFAKGLLDKLALKDVQTGTYLRNHFLYLDPSRLPEFQKRLDAMVATLVNEFAEDASARNSFLNVLITSTLS